MKLSTTVRWSRALLLVLVVSLISGVWLVMNKLSPSVLYGPTIVGDGNFILKLLSPLVAVMAAFLAHPIARYLGTVPVARHGIFRVLIMTWPVLAAGWLVHLGVLAYLGFVAGGVGALGDGRAVSMILVGLVHILAAYLIGTAAGCQLPSVVYPFLGAVGFLWITWLPSLSTAWPRNLVGLHVGCCAQWEEPLFATTLGALALGAGICVVAAMSILFPNRGTGRILLAVGTVVVLAVAGFWFKNTPALEDRFVLTQPRQEALICSGEAPRICSWPENAVGASEMVQPLAQSAYRRWADLPVDLRGELSASGTEGGGVLAYDPEASTDRLLLRISRAAITGVPADAVCEREPDLMVVLHLWLALDAGASAERLSVEPAVLAEATRIQRLDRRAQQSWVETAVDTLRTCTS